MLSWTVQVVSICSVDPDAHYSGRFQSTPYRVRMKRMLIFSFHLYLCLPNNLFRLSDHNAILISDVMFYVS
jgi:hypothetical protein